MSSPDKPGHPPAPAEPPLRRTNLGYVRSALARLGVRPRKDWGQNFLVDPATRQALVEAAALTGAEVVLEIGPGLGTLTEALAAHARRVVAVEKDRRLCAFLEAEFAAVPAIEIVQGDMLETDLDRLCPGGFDVCVSNLPYAVGSRLLVDLVRHPRAPRRIVVTVQREVAQRIAARPGTREYGALSVWCQAACRVKIARVIGAGCFWPRPEIRSAIVVLERHAVREFAARDEAVFNELTARAFRYRRKQILTALTHLGEPLRLSADDARRALQTAGITAQARPGDLDVGAWCRLADALPSGR